MQTRLFRIRLAIALLAGITLAAGSARAVITKPIPLAELLEVEDYIFVGTVDRLDPEKAAAVFKVEKNLKGTAPFDRLPVNMTGNAEAQKKGDTKAMFDRLDAERKVVFFVDKRGKNFNTMAFVEGTWFSIQGTQDADKTVRWGFQSGEPVLRRTFKGTSAELIKVLEDGLAKKAKPPAPDDKEKPGYGPAVEKKGKQPQGAGDRRQETGDRRQETGSRRQETGDRRQEPGARNQGGPATGRQETGKRDATRLSPVSCLLSPVSSPALFGVIPSFVLVGPLAVVAALFPGVFARLAVGMKRWRAFLVIASLNSTLALLFHFTQSYLPAGPWFGTKAFTQYLMTITAGGLIWAGCRYRRFAAEDGSITSLPTRTELYALGGLTLFAAACVCLTAVFTSWGTNLELPMREFTFIGIGLAVATVYATYRAATAHVDHVGGTPPDRRLSLSGESVGLAVLFLCGLISVLHSGNNTAAIATVTESGEAEPIGPRLAGDVKVFQFRKASQVLSGIAIDGDRLYFGTYSPPKSGNVLCINRETGEELWRFGDDEGMLPVFCTPRVVGGKVYCGEGLHENEDCRMFCFSAADGKALWAQPFRSKSHTEGSPVVIGNKLIFPAGDDQVVAVDASTGTQVWQYAQGFHVDGAPAVRGTDVFVGSGLHSFVAICLDSNTGNEKWRSDLMLRSFAAPLVLGNRVYYGVGTGNMGEDAHDYPEEKGTHKEEKAAGAVVCLEAETGKEVWRYDLEKSVHTALAGDAFSVYACSRDGAVYALDRKTGKLRWWTSLGSPITSAPAVSTSGGLPVAVYAVSREGKAVCLDPHTGKAAWEKPLPGFHWDGQEANGVLSGPAVVTMTTPTGSKRTIYIGAMTVDPDNTNRKTCAVFRFEDEVGGAGD